MAEATEARQERPEGRPPQADRSFSARLNHWLLNLFSSIRLAVILLIILAVTSIIGTVLAQGESSQDNIRLFTDTCWWFFNKLGMVHAASPDSVAHYQEVAQRYGLSLYKGTQFLKLDDLYRTWYFNVLLALLSVNLIVCSLRHWPHTWRFFRHPKRTLEGEGAAGIPLRREMPVKGSPTDAVARAQAALAARGYRAELTEAEGASHLFAQKGIWGRFGVYLVHLSVLFIFVGAVIGFQFGQKGYVAIEEGNSIDSVSLRGGKGEWKLPFQVRCDNFEISYYEKSHRPKDYKSWLAVIDGGRVVLQKTIEVNSPLIYQGIYFYQSNYGETGRGGKIKLRISARTGARTGEYWLPLGSEIEIPEFGLKARVLRDQNNVMQFFPDFDMNGMQPFTRSNQMNNPAAAVRFTTADGRIIDTWLLTNYPEVNSLKKADFNATFLAYDGQQYTGLQVAYDPGTPVVWLGCILMVAGIFTAFFIPHKRVWVKLGPGAKGPTAWVAGSTNRNRSTFEEEFERVAAGVKESLA